MSGERQRRPDQGGPGRTAETVAAIDCGTNSTRLLVADADGSTIDRKMRITRLGEGVDATRTLAPDAIERTLAVLRDYRIRMDDLGVVRTRLVTTSAARDAVNAEAFLEAAANITGTRAEILSGEEEARLSFAGATAHLPDNMGGGRELVVDVGGGSTEIAAGVPGATGSEVAAVSIDVGCVRLSERFLLHDPPNVSEVAAARSTVDEALARAVPVIGSLPPGRMVGLAGTVSALVSLELQLDTYDREAIHHHVITREAVEQLLATLACDTRAERLERPGMVPGRADVIVGGVVVLVATMAAFGRTSCLASEADILDGLVAGLLRAEGGRQVG